MFTCIALLVTALLLLTAGLRGQGQKCKINRKLGLWCWMKPEWGSWHVCGKAPMKLLCDMAD